MKTLEKYIVVTLGKSMSIGTRPLFKFNLIIRNTLTGVEMPLEYSGGILAFLSPRAKAMLSKSHPIMKHILSCASFNWKDPQIQECLTRILSASAVKKEDVFHSLLMDCDVSNYPSFEDWAESLGYDPDSRNALKIYLACQKQTKQFRALVGVDFTAIESELAEY